MCPPRALTRARRYMVDSEARTLRASLRAWRSGSGIRDRPATPSTICTAVSGTVRHPASPCLWGQYTTGGKGGD